ncbi:MAG: HEPN domain-containing protein [Bacteroidaceae bacterium]|nr:HEPN domain-containing protein [Bacteroidaceae bacterium]
MSLKEEDRKVIVALELDKVEKTLTQLDVQLREQLWEMAANRLYYALFHAVSAMLIHDHHEVGTHRGAVNMFSLYYVKEGIFTKEEGRLYSRLQRLREDGDYNCSIEVEQDEVEEKIEPTRQLIDKIKRYIAENKK